MVASPAVPADLGVRLREIPDRPDLVVLSFLGARFSRTPAWGTPGTNWAPDRCDISHFRCRECSRRGAVFVFDSAGDVGRRGTPCHPAGLRDLSCPPSGCATGGRGLSAGRL